MKKAEKAFVESAKKNMIEFEISGFKRTYPHLFKTIMEAMKNHSLDFAKWHDKTDILRNEKMLWTKLYEDYENKI